MQASEVLSISIRRPYADVYDFLAEPKNFTRWASLPDSIMEPLGGNDWLVDLPSGRRVIRLTPPNTFGVLDYQTFEPDEDGGPTVPARLVANGEGADLQITWFQREGMTDEQFRSEIEWAASDLRRLKTLLEGG